MKDNSPRSGISQQPNGNALGNKNEVIKIVL